MRFNLLGYLIWASGSMPFYQAGAQSCQIESTGLTKLIFSADRMVQAAHLSSVTENTSEYCHRNALLRSARTFADRPENLESLSNEELENFAQNSAFGRYTETPWESSLILTGPTTLNALKFSFRGTEFYKEENIKIGEEKRIKVDFDLKNLNESLKNFKLVTELDKKIFKENLKEVATKKNTNSQKLIFEIAKPVACSALNFRKTIACTKALNTAHKKMIPHGFPAMFNLPLWEKVLTDDKYDRGLQKTAQKVLSYIQDKQTNNANIFDDLKSSFRETGMNQEEAEDAAFEILGFLSNGGPNTAGRIWSLNPGLKNSTKGQAIATLSGALAHLDYLNMKKGRPLYSFPKDVPTTCNSGKPYHFWSSAYLTRSLIKDHAAEPDSAARATFITSKGYHLIREQTYSTSTYSASKMGFILNQETFHPTHQVVRMDLAYAAAGSHFGAAAGSGKKSANLNVDKTLIHLIKNGSPTKVGSGSNILSLYLNFDETFSPDTAFHFLEKKAAQAK